MENGYENLTFENSKVELAETCWQGNNLYIYKKCVYT